jgi:hypothetical protein
MSFVIFLKYNIELSKSLQLVTWFDHIDETLDINRYGSIVVVIVQMVSLVASYGVHLLVHCYGYYIWACALGWYHLAFACLHNTIPSAFMYRSDGNMNEFTTNVATLVIGMSIRCSSLGLHFYSDISIHCTVDYSWGHVTC